MSKQCKVCGIVKSRDDFYAGLTCKKCAAERNNRNRAERRNRPPADRRTRPDRNTYEVAGDYTDDAFYRILTETIEQAHRDVRHGTRYATDAMEYIESLKAIAPSIGRNIGYNEITAKRGRYKQ